VTIQTVPFATDLLMLAAAAVLVALLVAAAVRLVQGRPRPAAALAGAAAALVAVYVAADVGAGLASRPLQLRPGDVKCFDDWCASMTAAHRDPAAGALLVDVRLENHGRGRAMRSNLARAYLEMPGRASVAPTDGGPLHALVEPGQGVDVRLAFAAPPGVRDARFVVVEGDSEGVGPGTFEIGGEASPFHARAGWPLDAAS
jgi:hypothetical protein